MNNIEDVFLKDSVEINDIDFFEVIETKLNAFFSESLLNIILYSLETGVLNTILVDKKYELLKENFFIENLIHHHFQNTKFLKKGIMKYNKNKVTIYNDLQIPESKLYFEKLINYFNKEITPRYIENENNLRNAKKD